MLLTGLAVEIVLAPIALYHFHRAGLYGAVANIAAIPLTTFVIMPLEALALLLDIAGLGAPFWWLTGQSLALLLRIAHATAAAPGAVALLPSMPAGAFALIVARRPVADAVAHPLAPLGPSPRSPPARSGRSPPPRRPTY